MLIKSTSRPIGITALSIFFVFGAVAGFVSFVSLLFPGSFLEPLRNLNRQAREGFAMIGGWSTVLMFTVSIVCSLTATGLWKGKIWGYRLALIMLSINLLGDAANVISGTEPRAIIGVPIALAIITVLVRNKRVQHFFNDSAVSER